MGSGRDPRSPSGSSWSISFQLVSWEEQPASQPGSTDLQSGSKASSVSGIGSSDRTIACQRPHVTGEASFLNSRTCFAKPASCSRASAAEGKLGLLEKSVHQSPA
jgi:hypothetical protein